MDLITTITLSVIGLWLGYFYLPAIKERENRKKEFQRDQWLEAEKRASEIIGNNDGIGQRAPSDVPPPNGR